MCVPSQPCRTKPSSIPGPTSHHNVALAWDALPYPGGLLDPQARLPRNLPYDPWSLWLLEAGSGPGKMSCENLRNSNTIGVAGSLVF